MPEHRHKKIHVIKIGIVISFWLFFYIYLSIYLSVYLKVLFLELLFTIWTANWRWAAAWKGIMPDVCWLRDNVVHCASLQQKKTVKFERGCKQKQKQSRNNSNSNGNNQRVITEMVAAQRKRLLLGFSEWLLHGHLSQ